MRVSANKVCDEFNLDRNLVIARATDEMPQVAARCLRVLLDCKKLREFGAPNFRPISDGIRALRVSSELAVNENQLPSAVVTPRESDERTTGYQKERHEMLEGQSERTNNREVFRNESVRDRRDGVLGCASRFWFVETGASRTCF